MHGRRSECEGMGGVGWVRQSRIDSSETERVVPAQFGITVGTHITPGLSPPREKLMWIWSIDEMSRPGHMHHAMAYTLINKMFKPYSSWCVQIS